MLKEIGKRFYLILLTKSLMIEYEPLFDPRLTTDRNEEITEYVFMYLTRNSLHSKSLDIVTPF